MRAAKALRITLVELVLRIADTAQAERTGAMRRNELLIAELNHRVRNILGLVRGIPRSHDNPEFLWVDDSEVVGDLVAVSAPVPGYVVA